MTRKILQASHKDPPSVGRRPSRHAPIKVLVPLLVVVPTMIVALMLGYLAFSQSVLTANELVDQNTDQIHARIHDHLDVLLETPDQLNKLNARLWHGQE